MTKTPRALPSLSFEFFPPHRPEASLRLWRSVERLAPLAPRFVSVTYGAGRHHARPHGRGDPDHRSSARG